MLSIYKDAKSNPKPGRKSLRSSLQSSSVRVDHQLVPPDNPFQILSLCKSHTHGRGIIGSRVFEVLQRDGLKAGRESEACALVTMASVAKIV